MPFLTAVTLVAEFQVMVVVTSAWVPAFLSKNAVVGLMAALTTGIASTATATVMVTALAGMVKV